VLNLYGTKFNGDRLMKDIWNDRKLLRFTDDLKETTVPL